MSNDSALLLLLSMPLGMMAAEAGTYRVLGWRWGAALKVAVPSQVTGLGAGVLLLVLFERFFLRSFSSAVLVGMLTLGTAAVACGAPVVARLAPEELSDRGVFLVSSVVKVLLLMTVLAGFFFAFQLEEATEPPPAPEMKPRPAYRSLKSFSQNSTMY